MHNEAKQFNIRHHVNYFYFYFLYSIIFLASIYYLKTSFKQIQIPTTVWLGQNSNPIFIAILTGAPRVPLLQEQYNLWMKDFIATKYYCKIQLYSLGPAHFDNKFLSDNYIDTPHYEGDISRDMLKSKMYKAMNDFLSSTNSPWFLRLCDDTFVNLKAFDQFYAELTKGVDPYKDRIIQGYCLSKYKDHIYIQGGSGIIFSRAAVCHFLSSFDFFVHNMSHIKNDDTTLGIWLNKENYTSFDNTNRFFLGHRFWGFRDFTDLYNKSLQKHIHPCPNSPTSSTPYRKMPNHYEYCKHYITKLRNIAFWHDRSQWFRFIPYARDFIDNLPDYWYYYQRNRNMARVCYSNNSSIEKYY